MIKIINIFSVDFKTRYRKLSQLLYKRKMDLFHRKLSVIDYNKIRDVFPLHYFTYLSTMNAEDLNSEVFKLFNKYQVIYEFYCTSDYYKDCIELIKGELPLNSKINKRKFDIKLRLLKYKLAKHKEEKANHLAVELLDKANDINEIRKYSDKRKALIKIRTRMMGVKNDSFFPLWVSNIPNLFDYSSHVVQKLAIDIIQELGISVCPYCNIKDIEVDDYKIKIKNVYRPSLDHFYPKSKYPFLAISMYNLIPSCEECNRANKIDNDVISGEYINPHILGLNDRAVFSINELEDLLIKSSYIKLDKTDVSINVDIETHIDSIYDMFDIKGRVENKPEMKFNYRGLQVVKAFNLYNENPGIKLMGKELDFCEFLSSTSCNLNLSDNALNQEFMKFNVDLVNQVFNKNIEI